MREIQVFLILCGRKARAPFRQGKARDLFVRRVCLAIFMVIGISLSSCSTETSVKGKAVPGPGMTLVEKDLTWRGGAIGGALGSPVEGKISDILTRASREGAKEGIPMVYISQGGFQRVEVHPAGGGTKEHCRLVRVQVYQEGVLFRDSPEEVCW
jgi:hypothetical protein